MFQPSSRPFAEIARDLYMPASFQAPPPQVAVPQAPSEWVRYHPEQAGKVVTFAIFKDTPTFGQITQQIEERIAECKAFSVEHFRQEDRETIEEQFDAFLRNLKSSGEFRYFDDLQLQLLYGWGKEHLDNFCLLLRCPDIDLHQRKRALLELAHGVDRCRGAGAVFMEAFNALQQSGETLSGLYGQTLKDLFDDSVRRFVVEILSDKDDEYGDNMEVHIVNQFRMELGLPGADGKDIFTASGVVTRQNVSQCALWLLEECRPVVVAKVLASQYRSQLSTLAAEELRSDQPGSPSVAIDPGDSDHMDALMRAHGRLRSTFEGMHLQSLVYENAETGKFDWRGDDALVVRDLLTELAHQGLICSPKEGVVASGATADSRWSLCHLDKRVLYVQERLSTAGLRTAVGLSHLRFEHVLGLMENFPSKKLRRAAVDAILQSESATALARIPAKWLETEEQCERFLQRLDPAAAISWAQRQEDIPPQGIKCLLWAATAGGHASMVRHLMDLMADRAPVVTLIRGGLHVFHRAVASGSIETAQAWAALIRKVAAGLSSPNLAGFWASFPESYLVGPDDVIPTSKWLLRADPQMLKLFLQLVFDLAAKDVLSKDFVVDSLHGPVSDAMNEGRAQSLQTLVDYQVEAARRGWLPSGKLPRLLNQDGGTVGRLCAMLRGHMDIVAWFHEKVFALTHEQLLTPQQACTLLFGKESHGQTRSFATVVSRNAAALKVHLDAVVKAATCGWISSQRCLDILDSPGVPGANAMVVLMVGTASELATVWTDALEELHQVEAITSNMVSKLLTRPAIKGGQWMSLLPGLAQLDLESSDQPLLPAGQRLDNWGPAVIRLAQAHVLTHEQLLELLAGRHEGEPALLMAMKLRRPTPVIEELLSLLLRVHQAGLINDDELADLLEARSEDGSAAFSVASTQTVDRVLAALNEHVRQGRLPEAVFNRLSAHQILRASSSALPV
ncbi:hypothetical protein SAMN05216359_107156 [Roseateles sp. YR242]|uniref:hypothetical protein n=1 Tax=Roseateles sp. YR242 TaxID=1855305 RepID=UPI0008D7D080|nr:hypothetical protein [Roseateles sp. YR242]SEL30389.1 hypothetical protein SAMN05216359_107156 [Roseateles sp. YR242]